MTVSPNGNVTSWSGCTCRTCPVHSKPPCPSCGATGAHYCPGPSSPHIYKEPYTYGTPTYKPCPCGKVGAHVCWTVTTNTIK